MPAIATLEELQAVGRQIEQFKAEHPEAYQAMVELLKKNRRVGYKNICKILIGETTPEQLKAGSSTGLPGRIIEQG